MNGHNIIIADDHKLFRKGLMELVSGMKEAGIIREAEDGLELIKSIEEKEPDLVILDLELPNLDGFEAAKIITRDYPNIKILVLTMYDNEDFVSYLWELGIHGYLLKNSQLDEMYKAITSVIENDFYKNDVVQNTYKEEKNRILNLIDLPEPDHLSNRERDVLYYIMEEKTSKEIGKLLGISNRTVEKIRKNLMERYNKKTVVGLIKFAIKNKLIYV